jgi:hypothetical protein
MARLSARARPDRERVLHPARQLCPGCGGHMRLRYENRRTLVLLTGAVRLRCRSAAVSGRAARAIMWRTGPRRKGRSRCRSMSSGWT